MTAMTSETPETGMKRRRGRVLARGLLVVVALALLPLAAALQAPRPAVAQAAVDSLWTGAEYPAGSKVLAACANPSSAEALASCFGSPIDSQGVTMQAMATDGVNVYYAGSMGGLSCPIADLGANCTRIMAGDWGNPVYSLAARGGQLWIGQGDGKIYRCPANLAYSLSTTAPAACVLLYQAKGHRVDSLLLANNTLYAGISQTIDSLSQPAGPEFRGYRDKDHGSLLTCDPQQVKQCTELDNYGNTTARSLAADGTWLWAGLEDGIIWRCDPIVKDSCENWENGYPNQVVSISLDGRGTLYAAVNPYQNNFSKYPGVIWSCPMAVKDSCSNVIEKVYGTSVAAGAGGVFSSTSSSLQFGTNTFTAANEEFLSNQLLYIPAGGPVGVGGVKLQMKGQWLSRKLAGRCQAGKDPTVVLEVVGPHGVARTVKAGVCALAKGRAVKTFDLMQPGEYTITAQFRKRSAENTIVVRPDRNTTVKLKVHPYERPDDRRSTEHGR